MCHGWVGGGSVCHYARDGWVVETEKKSNIRGVSLVTRWVGGGTPVLRDREPNILDYFVICVIVNKTISMNKFSKFIDRRNCEQYNHLADTGCSLDPCLQSRAAYSASYDSQALVTRSPLTDTLFYT